MAPRFDDYDSMTRLGDIVIKAAKTLGRRIAVIASGDLSHRLLQGSPNGYTPNGAVFDKLVMEALLKQNLSGLSDLSRSFIDEIATCGLPSVYFLFGVLRHFRPVMPVYAYEAPFASATASPSTFRKDRKIRSKKGAFGHPRPPGPRKHYLLPAASRFDGRPQRSAGRTAGSSWHLRIPS